MSIDYRHTCDKCGKSLIDDGVEIYCEDCFTDLQSELEEAREEIKRLQEEIQYLTEQLEEIQRSG